MLFLDPVGDGRANRPDDVLNAKRAFSRLGRYRIPSYGLTGYIDRDLDDAVKGFQDENGLRVDGRIDPGGPTQRRLEETLGARWQTVADRRSDRPDLRVDLPDWTPRLADPKSGEDVLAPDGKPFTLDRSRTKELLDQARRLGRREPEAMSKSELDDLRRLREGLSGLWGSGMPRIEREEAPAVRSPAPPLARPRPNELTEEKEEEQEEEGFFDRLRGPWGRLDEEMQDPDNAPVETPPIDPPGPPLPPFLPRGRLFRRPRL